MTITTRRLIEDHTRIRAAGDALAAAVDCTTPLPEDHLQELRWALARESLQHLGLDERYVHIPLEQHADPTVCATAKRIREHAEQFSVAYRGHVAEWSADEVANDWRGYGRSVKKLVERLHERLDLEERELYRLLNRLTAVAPATPQRNWAGDAWSLRASIHGPAGHRAS